MDNPSDQLDKTTESDIQLDTESNDLDRVRKQQRLSCSDIERDAFRQVLANDVTCAYFMWWNANRKNSAPLGFRRQYDAGARETAEFEAPSDVPHG